MERIDLARAKLEQENATGMEEELRSLIMCWLEADGIRAAGMILQDDKTIKGAMEAMRNKARAKSRGTCAGIGDAEAMEIVLMYYGMDSDMAKSEIEGGLMYKIIMAAASRWKPYGHEANPQPVADLTEKAEVETNAQPVADLGTKKKFDLSSLSLEDEL